MLALFFPGAVPELLSLKASFELFVKVKNIPYLPIIKLTESYRSSGEI